MRNFEIMIRIILMILFQRASFMKLNNKENRTKFTLKPVNASIGSSVQLECPRYHTEYYPSWSQEDEEQGRIIADNDQIDPNDPRSSRIELVRFPKSYYNLVIHSITRDDADMYCCTTVNKGIPNSYCTQLFILDQENPQIDIKQQNGTLECSVSGIETNITFSWTHYTKDGEHISCHDRTDPLLLLTKYEPYETEGIYSCTATFNETDNVKNTSVLQKSANISGIEGKPYCFWMRHYSMLREDETAKIKVYVYSAGGVTFRLARPDSNVHENDTTVNSIFTKRTSYPVNICNTIIDVDVQEYQLELSSLISMDLNMTLTLLINNTVGETYCSQTFFVGNDTADDDADKRETYIWTNIVLFKYIIGCFGCTVFLCLLSAFMKQIRVHIDKVIDCAKCRCKKRIQSTSVSFETRRYREEVVFNPSAEGHMFIIQD